MDDVTLELTTLAYARLGMVEDAAFLLSLAATGTFLDSPTSDDRHSLTMVRSLLLAPADTLEPVEPVRVAYPFLSRGNVLQAPRRVGDSGSRALRATSLPLALLFCLSRAKPSANTYAILARAASR